MDRSKSIRAAVQQEMSLREIARLENVSPNTISYWLKKLGLKTKLAKNIYGNKPPKHNLLNKKFGLLIAISSIQIGNSRAWFWICKCDCGNKTKPLPSNTLLRGTTTSCGCRRDQYDKIRGKNSSQFTGYEEIHGRFWSKIKLGAMERNYKFLITIQQAWNLFIEQNRTCALSGIPIVFSKTSDSTQTTASLDRIDSSKNYTLDNIQWVHRKVNFMKHTLLQEEFIKLCKKVSQYNE